MSLHTPKDEEVLRGKEGLGLLSAAQQVSAVISHLFLDSLQQILASASQRCTMERASTVCRFHPKGISI